jgi:cell division protein FtsZ
MAKRNPPKLDTTKMTVESDGNSGNGTLKRSFAIKVLGVGGAGCNAVNHLARESFTGVSFTVMNTDAPALAQSPVENKLVLGLKSMRGLGAGGDPERGRSAAQEDISAIRALCEGADVVFVVAGLGGGTGTGAGPVVAQVAKETGALVLSIVMLPFDCEGSRRQRQAQLGLHELKSAVDGVICLPNQKVLKLIDEKTSLLEAFQITNEFVAQGVRGIWRLLSRPGLINVDFADLCAVTQGKHAESALATAEAKGENRAREVMEKLLAHPLIDGGQVLSEAAGILVCIAGGPDLAMADVNRIMEQINRHGEQAHIIMGATVDEEFEDRLSVTLIAARRNGRIDEDLEFTTPADRKAGPRAVSANVADLEDRLVNTPFSGKPASRFVAPAPDLTPDKVEQLLTQQGANGTRQRKNAASRMRQGQLPLEIISKGRFEKSEPTIHHGQDLDVPTYIRRGVALN